MVNYKRRHWAVENALHRILDVEVNEDDSQKKENSARNYYLVTIMGDGYIKS